MKATHDWRKMSEELGRESEGHCEVCGRFIGILEKSNIHHVLARSKGGSDDVENLMAVCSFKDFEAPDCHDWIHGHPKESKIKGWLK